MGFSEFYEDYAKAEFVQVNSEKVNEVALKFLKSPVLDLGCFFGEKTAFLSKHFDKVDGCDISKIALEKAKKRHPKLKFFQCDFEKKELKLPKKYNSIFAAEIIEHLFDTQLFLKNCYNNLNKSGILLLTTPNVVNISNRVRLLFGSHIFVSGDKAHIRFFKPKTIRQELEKAGFEVIYLTGFNARKFTKKIPMPTNFCEGIIAVGRK